MHPLTLCGRSSCPIVFHSSRAAHTLTPTLPVRVCCTFVALDTPVEVDFGRCPVNLATTRVVSMRNVGTRRAKFVFRCSENFRVAPPGVVLTHGVDVV